MIHVCKHLPSREQLSLFLQLHNQSKIFVNKTLQLFCLRSWTALSKNKNILQYMKVLLYTYFYNISLNALRTSGNKGQCWAIN